MKPNIGILSFPTCGAGNIPLSNLVDIIFFLSNDVYLITGNAGYKLFKDDVRVHAYGIKHETGANIFTRILKYIYVQFKISYNVLKISKSVDMWIFFFGGDTLVIPMLAAKLCGKKVVLNFTGSSMQTLKSASDTCFKPIDFLSKINCFLSNRIIIYSKNLMGELNLKKYKNKIFIAHKHFLDFEKFKILKKLGERDDLIGYVGRLSEEKGVLNFVKAIPEVIRENSKIKFLIGGDGQLQYAIEKYLGDENLDCKVKLVGWIFHDELPKYLNELKLLVLPSYTEGLPNIILEAMACGTPVLANSVGGVPDIIQDGETGFIMESNSPLCIAREITSVLEYDNLESVVNNAYDLVREKFAFSFVAGNYKKIIEGEN